MTNQKESSAVPMKMIPAGKDYLWGGERLKQEFGKQIDLTPLAETWECSTHPDGLSRVQCNKKDFQNDFLSEKSSQADSVPQDNSLYPTLKDILAHHPEYYGSHPFAFMKEDAAKGELPILVKWIDAAKDLSVQVHPDDEYAVLHENGQRGKTEMWYVVDAKPDTSLVYGFRRTVSRDLVKRAILSNRLDTYLQKVPVKKNDVFFIPAGTVHAIGKGSLLVEVQENSNLTYRLFDYHRKGPDGKERQLHVEKALDVANLKEAKTPRQPLRTLRYRPGMASEFLCRCKYFEVQRLLIHTRKDESQKDKTLPLSIPYRTQETSFHVLICIEGEGVLSYKNVNLSFRQGDTFFVPADSVKIMLCGSACFLDVNC